MTELEKNNGSGKKTELDKIERAFHVFMKQARDADQKSWENIFEAGYLAAMSSECRLDVVSDENQSKLNDAVSALHSIADAPVAGADFDINWAARIASETLNQLFPD